MVLGPLRILYAAGVEITIFCINFPNFIFQSISCNNLARRGKLIYISIGTRLRILRRRAKYIFFKTWNKNKYNSNICTCNFTKQCTFSKLQELFRILRKPFSYFGIKQLSKGKYKTEPITISGRITKRIIFDSLDINKASIS